ncbi:metal dependent phosphohydrolase [Thermotomaculum hydrothermale]|uniref:Metal dependent phosphohydrolase n=1 Tax=Thermotomaculum hydrothermale TaxID=981385 RepID=A0A7R6PRK1_9BACT|nr:HDIG domain-containing metalloprotein [Thermotomaculum hydrothermale]BBB33041.1 metal dependent phosphohydrolase [Thermotomaculum hydrothermale]
MENIVEKAEKLVNEYVKSDSLKKHLKAVACSMKWYARKFGEDEDRWYACGLLHDFDYEKYPDAENHPYRGAEILEKEGFDKEFVEAVLGHASYTGVERKTLMAKTLFAVDELSGFVIAVALVRPSKLIGDVKVKSVKKKMKDKAFARQVNRDEIKQGAEELGIPLEEHIQNVITALTECAKELGFEG